MTKDNSQNFEDGKDSPTAFSVERVDDSNSSGSDILFTKDEIYWMERAADIESTLLLNKFFQLVQIKIDDKSPDEQNMIKAYGTELINAYSILKQLREKLELHRNG